MGRRGHRLAGGGSRVKRRHFVVFFYLFRRMELAVVCRLNGRSQSKRVKELARKGIND